MFRPRHSTSLQLARLIERITRNFGEKMFTGAVFLDVAKASDSVWIDCLLYKLTLNVLSYMPPRLHHVELSFYADDTAIIATSCKSTLLVSYLEP